MCREFRHKGHEAYSCDIVPCSGGKPEWHIQGDVVPLLSEQWDMIIAFPPCTHLAVSGAAWWKQKQADGRQQQGMDFFMLFINLDCPRVAVENPVGIMSTYYRKPDQIIQPYMFGDPTLKTTCLWLKGLPLLRPTNIVKPADPVILSTGKRVDPWYYSVSGLKGAARSAARSKTFPGIAKAMADQWG